MAKENAMDLRRISDGAKHLHALQVLKRPTMHWEDLLVLILISKLDSLTLREWEISLMGNELSLLKQLLDFITHRCQMLEATTRASTTSSKKVEAKSQPNVKRSSSAIVKSKCHFCQEDYHLLLQKLRGISSITKGRGNSQSQTLRQLLALFFSWIK